MTGHGYGPYTNGCRCQICRDAKAAYMAVRRAAARSAAQKHTATPTGGHGNRYSAWAVGATRFVAAGIEHGTRAGYDEHGCRCAECTAARTSTDARYRVAAS